MAACFSAAERCTFTARISARCAPSWSSLKAKGQGAGGNILKALIEEAETHGVQSVCLFTRIPDFFFKYGFRTVEDKSELPDKIFKDCQMCPRLHRCDEVAMVRGRIPRMSILGPRDERSAGAAVRCVTRRRSLGIPRLIPAGASAFRELAGGPPHKVSCQNRRRYHGLPVAQGRHRPG
jgi:hypothetical protein